MCVFKYHAFIYFLRPPPWYGTILFKELQNPPSPKNKYSMRYPWIWTPIQWLSVEYDLRCSEYVLKNLLSNKSTLVLKNAFEWPANLEQVRAKIKSMHSYERKGIWGGGPIWFECLFQRVVSPLHIYRISLALHSIQLDLPSSTWPNCLKVNIYISCRLNNIQRMRAKSLMFL